MYCFCSFCFISFLIFFFFYSVYRIEKLPTQLKNTHELDVAILVAFYLERVSRVFYIKNIFQSCCSSYTAVILYGTVFVSMKCVLFNRYLSTHCDFMYLDVLVQGLQFLNVFGRTIVNSNDDALRLEITLLIHQDPVLYKLFELSNESNLCRHVYVPSLRSHLWCHFLTLKVKRAKLTSSANGSAF